MSFAGRLRAVIEDMPQMSTAIGAVHFGAGYANLVVNRGSDSSGFGTPECGPAGAAFILRFGRIKQVVTTRAVILARALFVIQRRSEATLRARFAQDVKLLAR